MKIIYLANVRMPTEKAHGLQVMKMCEALASQGQELELVVPRRLNCLEDDAFEYYRVKKIFSITKIACLDLLSLPFFKAGAFWLQILTFSFGLAVYLFFKKDVNLVYTRDLICLLFMSKRFKVVYEAHNLPKKQSWLYCRLISRVDKIVAITQGLRDDLKKLGISPSKIFIAPDAADLEQFAISDSQKDCRQKLKLSLDEPIALYAGHLYQWKGVYTVLESAKLLPEILFVFVGGLGEELSAFLKRLKDLNLNNVLVVGQKKNEEIPYFLKAADVLILPNSAQELISARYTSPLKLFEYMSSGVPIVSTSPPSIKEILNDRNAVLVEADNFSEMAKGIKRIIEDKNFGNLLAAQALFDVKDYTWQNRTKNILQFINL